VNRRFRELARILKTSAPIGVIRGSLLKHRNGHGYIRSGMSGGSGDCGGSGGGLGLTAGANNTARIPARNHAIERAGAADQRDRGAKAANLVEVHQVGADE
jgi:hypothetical protein